ncbi:MAG: hypothetical protein ACRDSN_07285, partial [Pseudonocardiaceae bacterium]
MRIAVDKRGGLFPVDRRVEIDDNAVRVTDTPPGATAELAITREQPLATTDALRLRELASQVVAAGDQIDDGPGGVDAGATVIDVDDGQGHSRVEIRMGRT